MAEQELRRQLARLASLLQLPGDLVAGVPKLELTGFGELVLEQHRGIERYAPEEITVRVSLGMIRITGDGLIIRQMNDKRIAVTGRIRAVALEGDGT